MAGLLDKRLWIVSGKGGVGKSTIAAALALRSARAGKRTLVCEVNTQERISRLLGHQPVGPQVTKLEDNLWAVDVRPQEAMREYALMVLRFETLYKTVFENKVVRYFLRFIPSLQELVLLGKILFHAQEKRPDGQPLWDTIVMDAPATGHAITFLRVPQVLLQTVPPGPVNETLELHAALRDSVRVRTHAAVLNAAFLERFTEDDLEALVDHPELLRVARAHHDRASQTVLAQLKLERNLHVPVYQVPRIFTSGFGRAAIEQVMGHLEELVTGKAGT
jgi:anion-transporting  ArsA/GET3 family ATPase